MMIKGFLDKIFVQYFYPISIPTADECQESGNTFIPSHIIEKYETFSKKAEKTPKEVQKT